MSSRYTVDVQVVIDHQDADLIPMLQKLAQHNPALFLRVLKDFVPNPVSTVVNVSRSS